jgi:hypothetical protein
MRKEDLSIYITFNPCYFCWTVPLILMTEMPSCELVLQYRYSVNCWQIVFEYEVDLILIPVNLYFTNLLAACFCHLLCFCCIGHS